MMASTEKTAEKSVIKSRKKNGRFSRKGHRKKLSGLDKARLLRIAKSKGEPLPVFDRYFEDDTETGESAVNCDTDTYVDHDYLNVQQEVTVNDDVYPPVDDDAMTDWRVGRRIVDLGVLADGLKACQLCQLPLYLHNCVGEKKFGLSQILEVKCDNCNLLNNVATGRRHRTDKGGLAWDANTKLAAGMINGGLGESHVNTLLAILNIPGICHANLKEREREVGEKLEEMAIASCSRNLANEVALTESQEDGIVVSFDGAWQKRGTGRAYNSLTGHATLIGQKTGKCVGYALKSKKCRICSAAKAKNVTPRKHNCKKNWSGSAKAMEPAMACEMLQSILDCGEKVSTLVMDNDSTTIARVKSTVDKDITKHCDSNHTKKGFTGSLIELSKTHKLLRNTKVRTHIERCFTYSISQNRGEPEQLAKGLSSIVPHLYGDHSSCGTWCRGNEEGYKHQALPYGKPLNDQDLRAALTSLMDKFACKATELANMGSTQANESFNNMASSKAPKRLFYGGSESLATRLSATVCQKNDGFEYISELNKNCSLSPGTFTKKHLQRKNKKLKSKRLQTAQPSVKRRRLELKAERQSKNASQAVLEGDTYRSHIGLESEGHNDIEDIQLETPVENLPTRPLVFFDLETGGLGRTSDIVQIAAKSKEKQFSVYVLPTRSMSKEASEVTCLTFDGNSLCYKGEPVPAVPPLEAFMSFLSFLESFDRPVLVGHNVQNFDIPILRHHFLSHGLLARFKTVVAGFLDTLKLSKNVLKDVQLANYKQETLVRNLLGEDYEAHNAMSDVTSLEKLYFSKLGMFESAVCENVFYMSYYTCKESLEPLLKSKVVSACTLRKLVINGLSLSKLQQIHARDPENGIRSVFSEPMKENSKSVRITKSSKVIQKVVDYFSS